MLKFIVKKVIGSTNDTTAKPATSQTTVTAGIQLKGMMQVTNYKLAWYEKVSHGMNWYTT